MATLAAPMLVTTAEALVMQLEDASAFFDKNQAGKYTRGEFYVFINTYFDFTADAKLLMFDIVDEILAVKNPNRKIAVFTYNTRLKKHIAAMRAA